MSNASLAGLFLLQIAVVLLSCRVVGWLASKVGQPQVVAEMIAGVLLGPSFFGLLFPAWQQAIFPWDSTGTMRDTSSYLYPASQLGLALYMFLVGMEFRLEIVRQYAKKAIAVSAAGMLAPFGLGAVLAWIFFHYTNLFPPRASEFEAMLFLGASMCITAFPMLARIIQFKGLSGTPMGTIALGAGAIDDASAWCLLAIVLSSFDNNFQHALSNIGGGIAYAVLMLWGVRPILARWSVLFIKQDHVTDAGMAVALACMAVGSWFTDRIGLHGVFGAFIMGAVMPRGVLTRDLVARIQPLTGALLLPLFFTYSGLNTRITLLNSGFLWAMSGLVLLTAIAGKGIACWLAARWTGMGNREALGIGTLMNARGLMELIIINIGLQRGVISEGLFSILVVMAVTTTLMASPLFDLVIGVPAAGSTRKLRPETARRPGKRSV